MELLKELEQFNTFAEVRDHLSSFNIVCKVDPNNDNLYLITYDREKSDFTLPFMKQCRGTILEKGTNKIVCYTFDKGLDFEFSDYDLNDKEMQLKVVGGEDLDWNSCQVEESVDGTQIRLFYYDGKWCKATTRCSDAYRAYWYSDRSFGDLFDEAAELGGFNYDALDKSCCYSFVLCHPENRIVVRYDNIPRRGIFARENHLACLWCSGGTRSCFQNRLGMYSELSVKQECSEKVSAGMLFSYNVFFMSFCFLMISTNIMKKCFRMGA